MLGLRERVTGRSRISKSIQIYSGMMRVARGADKTCLQRRDIARRRCYGCRRYVQAFGAPPLCRSCVSWGEEETT